MAWASKNNHLLLNAGYRCAPLSLHGLNRTPILRREQNAVVALAGNVDGLMRLRCLIDQAVEVGAGLAGGEDHIRHGLTSCYAGSEKIPLNASSQYVLSRLRKK